MSVALVGTIGVSLLLAGSSAMAQVPDPVMAAQAPTPGSGHNYIGLATETVNPADGSLSFDLPLPTPPGRGISLPFSIHYDSGLNYSLSPYNDLTSTFPALDWTLTPQSSGPFTIPFLSFQAKIKSALYPATGQGQTSTYEQCDWTTSFVFRGLDGVQYPLGQVGATWSDEASAPGDPPDPFCAFERALGGTFHGILVTPGTQSPNLVYGQPSMTLTDASGTTYSFAAMPIGQISSFAPFTSPEILFPQTITDRNGNQITLTILGPHETGYIDTLGRTVASWTYSETGSTINVSGFGNVSISSTTSSGKLTFPGTITDTAHTNLACVKNSTQPNATTYTQQSVITLPNGKTYTLSFDPSFGQINKILFPGSGYVRYVWGLNTNSSSGTASYTFTSNNVVYTEGCNYEFDTPAITDRYVSYDGTHEVLHQQFSYTTTWWPQSLEAWIKTTTVTTTDMVTGQVSIAKYTYGPIQADIYDSSSWLDASLPVERSIQYENASGTVLETVNKTWGDVRHVIGEQTILFNPQGGNGQGSAKQYCYDANEQLVGVYEYGFPGAVSKPADPACYTNAFNLGSGAQGDPGLANSQIGPLMRTTITALHNFAAANPPTHIANEPDSVTVYNGSNVSSNQVMQSSFIYDGSAVVGSGVTTQTGLGSPPGVRGNATSITRSSNTGASPTTTYTYYETGQMASMTDPCGNVACPDVNGSSHKTTYSYGDNPSAGNQPGNSNAYLTTITDPLGHMRNFSYDYPSGKPTTSTDEYVSGSSGNTTTYHYNTQASQCSTSDGLDRLTEVDYPDGGVTSYCYNDSVPSITTNQLLSASTWKTSVSTKDGLGHVIATELTSDPGGADYTRASYDGMGQVYQVWNPSRCNPLTQTSCSGESTWGITTYGYDPVGRKSSQTNPGGTSESWGYNANIVTFTDESGSQWQQTTDGLGRLTVVQEPNGASTVASMETDYQYDANNNLTRVDQWGGAQGSTGEVARTFNYNSLNQLLCSSNPESATNPQNLGSFTPVPCPSTVTSSYTVGTLGYTYDANGNVATRTDARGVTATYSYDTLNRVLSKTYNDNGNTPSLSFAYDSGVLGITSGNYVGRLAQVETVAGSSVLYNYSTLGYDKVGRPLGYLECPGVSDCITGAATVLGANYLYNLAGNLAQATSQGTIASNGTTTGGVNQRNYSYDAASHLSTVTADARMVGGQDAGPVTLFTSPAYDAAGQLTAAGLAVSPSTRQSMIGLTRTYDFRLRPLSELDTGQVGTPGTPATVTVNVTGTEQSIGGSGTPTQATGAISLSYSGTQVIREGPLYVGNSITLPDGYHASFIATANSAIMVANALAAVLNAASSPVTAVVSSGGTANAASVALTTKATGVDQNGPITLSMVTTQVKAAPASLSGGGGATYDTGAVTANVNGTALTTSYGQTSTSLSVAQGLASAINGANLGVTASAGSGGALTVTSTQAGTAGNGIPVTLSQVTNEPKFFSSPSFSGASGTLGGGSNGTLSPGTVYSYSIPSPPTATTGYAGNGNLLSFTDLINGQWTATYDTLNRLSTATVAGTPSSTLTWSYDSFGNRRQQGPSGGQLTYPAGNNRISGYAYDASGNVLDDGSNQYGYDGEGRVCTVYNKTLASYTGYAYDGLGNRVARGAATNGLSCDNTLTATSAFIVGPTGEQLDELNGTAAVYSNVFANGQLLATYQFSTPSWTYALNDWLGTKRVVANASGQTAETCTGLPFGDRLTCTGTGDPSPQHFTGQIHDQESNNDYFGARYYSEYTGRFTSPDPSGLLAQKPGNPQSWNLYAYAMNNPLSNIDPTGLDCVYANDAGNRVESIDHQSNSDECGQNGGSWAPGYVNESWAHFNGNTNMFQVGSINGAGSSATVDYTMFAAGATTQFNGDETACTSGCSGFSLANSDWLSGQLVGNSMSGGLDGYIQFLTSRELQLSTFSQIAYGPLDYSQNNWAGPGGFGPPSGDGDWRASLHDYNFNTNGITIGSYFNPFLSPATSKALIQSNSYLMQTGGYQGAKEKIFFGVVNAFQWASHLF